MPGRAYLILIIHSANGTSTTLSRTNVVIRHVYHDIWTAAAVAANKVKRPVRLWLSLEDNMCMLGKRTQYLFDYKMGITDGKIQAMVTDLYCDGGWSLSDVDSGFAVFFALGNYKVPFHSYFPPITSLALQGACCQDDPLGSEA